MCRGSTETTRTGRTTGPRCFVLCQLRGLRYCSSNQEGSILEPPIRENGSYEVRTRAAHALCHVTMVARDQNLFVVQNIDSILMFFLKKGVFIANAAFRYRLQFCGPPVLSQATALQHSCGGAAFGVFGDLSVLWPWGRQYPVPRRMIIP